MENVSDEERCCIVISHQARLAAANARLAELEKNGIPFDSPISGIAGGIEWEENIGGRIMQAAILPLVLVFSLFLYVMTPVAYIQHLRKVHQKKKELEREIQAIESELLSDQVPDRKDVESLWRLHGLDERKYSLDERVNLLSNWIDTLYGKDASNNLRLKSKAEDIAERNFKANLPCYEDKDAPHFRFVSPVDSMARQLSEELPPYQ